jgi:phosphoribosylformylglycinamidine synthase subunit PurL
MAQACEALETPVVSGNVSFYNESFGTAIYPTPMVGMLGVMDDYTATCDHRLKKAGDMVVLLGPDAAAVDGSEYQKAHYGRVEGRIPDVDLDLERRLQAAVREGVQRGLLTAAHDLAEGGLAVALAEMAIGSGTTGGLATADPTTLAGADHFLGARVAVASRLRPDLALFGEGPSRVLVTLAPADVKAFRALATGVPMQILGSVGGDTLELSIAAADGPAAIALQLPVADLRDAYESLPSRLA